MKASITPVGGPAPPGREEP